jgi:beta-xylosidase
MLSNEVAISMPAFFRAVFAILCLAPFCQGAAPWTPDRGDGSYQNPVLFADYSDPDAVRVGEDYYLVSSSFNHVPGLPILHSKDLVNWTLINHALPTLSYAESTSPGHFSEPHHGEGVWAPAIRYHDGRFWIYFPDPDFGIYVTTAKDPAGQWTAPVLVKGGKGLIDPCPLWDDDGQLYLVHGWAKSRSGINNQLTLHKLSPDGGKVIDEGKVIIDANKLQGITTLEGPKLYKRNGWYYVFAPVGGVTQGTQAIFRSKTLFGAWENRIVLAQGKTAVNGPHQGAWVDTAAGENWFLHFQDRGPFGRVVHLEPMTWRDDGWPAMGTAAASGSELGEPVITYRKPAGATASIAVPATSDEFSGPELALQWQWQANPKPAYFSLSSVRGSLRLACWPAPASGSLYLAPQLLLQKFPGPAFTATTKLTLQSGRVGDEAGLIVFGYSYAWIGLRRTESGLQLVQMIHPDANGRGIQREAASVAVKSGVAYLRVSTDTGGRCRFAYSLDGEKFQAVGEELQSTVGRWVGAKVGIFAAKAEPPGGAGALQVQSAPKVNRTSVASAEGGQADFDWFRVSPLVP